MDAEKITQITTSVATTIAVIITLVITIWFQISNSNRRLRETIIRDLYSAFDKRQYMYSKLNYEDFLKNFNKYIIEINVLQNAHNIKKWWCINCKIFINPNKDILEFIKNVNEKEVYPWSHYYLLFYDVLKSGKVITSRWCKKCYKKIKT